MTDSWACFLQRFSTPWLDALMYWITNLGSETFYVLILPGLYWLWNKRSAYKVGVVYLGSVYVNAVFKTVFHTPRPVPTDCARVMHPETGTGYAFPSGHAQGATVFWGQLAVQVKRRAMWAAAVILIILVSLSRIYLNVHWPIDVVGGILIGAVILRIFNVLALGWENAEPPLWLQVAFSIGVPVCLAILHHDHDSIIVLGFLIGFPAGRVIEEKHVRWRERAPIFKQALKFVLGILGLYCIRYGLKSVFPEGVFWDLARYAIAGLWVSLGAPYLFVRFAWQDPE